MSNALKLALGAAAVVVASLVALNVLGGGTIPMVGSSPSPIPSPSTDSLPLPRLPGMTASPAGEYGWVGGPSSSVGMHKINEQERRPVASLTFGVSPFCLGTSEDREAVPVRVAGFDGVSIEPFERSVIYGGGQSWIDPVTRAYELAVADRFLCVWLAWNATTTADELAAVEDILDTLRAVPVGEHGIRITFTLDEGWDRG